MLNQKRRSYRKQYVFLAAGLLVIAAVFTILEVTNTTHIFHKSKPVATTGGQYTKGVSPPANSTTNNDTSSSNQSSSNSNVKQPENSSASATLTAPWGTFANVYNAHYGDQMGSTCNTTPGATCQIIFTMGEQTRSLNTTTTDAGGAVYWSWKPNEISLTPGIWHITAKAVLGTQTKTTSNDPLTLTITP
jgi:hypothetical protein